VQPLPIDTLIPQVKSTLLSIPNLIIEAAPGAGKTTRLPPALLAPEISGEQEVWVLEPRRIAARLSARRVAEELQEKLGETVGYQVRFEEIGGPRTRLRFLTEGVLTRRLLSNPTLHGVAAVVLDEFHERHLQSDLALALLRRLQLTTRPDLKVIVMSATLEAASLASYLGDCPVIKSEGRVFEIAVEYQKEYNSRPLAEQVVAAIKKLLTARLAGDILVFLPGAAEIKRAQAACAELAAQSNLLVLPLHGELSSSEQDVAIRPSAQRKVILATNVAETSITIDGVAAVIDSGLARIAEHSPWSGLPTLSVQRISKASAVQRAGRAGRTREGVCLRLYTEMDYAARPAFETPEIQRLDLAGAALELHAAGVQEVANFAWFDSPTTQSIEAADTLLRRLGAINKTGAITELGRKMLRLPLHPRQARIFVEASQRGVAKRGSLIAALIGERDLRAKGFFSSGPSKPRHLSDSDLFEQESLYVIAQREKFIAARLMEYGINPNAAQAVQRTAAQILRQAKQASDNEQEGNDSDTRIRLSVLAGYPDRVARRRASDNGRQLVSSEMLNLANGGVAQLAVESVVRQADFLVAVEAEEKKMQRTSQVVIRCASAIEPDWLLDLFPNDIYEDWQIGWNEAKERVEVLSQLCYEKLVLDERLLESTSVNSEQREMITQTLAAAVMRKGWRHFLDATEILRLMARLDFVRQHFPEVSLPEVDEGQLLALLEANCEGKTNFAELRQAMNLDSVLHTWFSSEQLLFLEHAAPERINIAGRKNLLINYEPGKPPWIASRLQDFFGMRDSPVIGQGRVPLVLHLLAPNQRPVQITSDLAGFWARTYPQVRRELSRRYPKHAWPENPRQHSAKEKQKL
jgi:ATP-dependent helicase HrpB